MTTQDKIVDRVRKLLELSKSDNVNESASAAKQAQILMSKFTITEAMLTVEDADNETEEPIATDMLHRHTARTMPSWKIWLADGMCRVNQCRVLIAGNRLSIVGRPSDADTVRYLFSYVCREIDRLTKQEARLMGRPGRTYLNNFRLGAQSEVNQRLREAAKEAREAMKQQANAKDDLGTGTALVVVNKALAKIEARGKATNQYVADNVKGSHSMSQGRYSGEGRSRGRKAGASINLSGGSGSLGSGQRKALNG